MKFKNSTNLRSILCSDKVKLSAEERPEAVYNVRRGCKPTCIGETKHTVAYRFHQHQTAISAYKSAEKLSEITVTKGHPEKKDPRKVMEEAASSLAVVEHVVACLYPDDQVTGTRMHHEPFFRLQILKEALYIRHNRCINRDKGAGISATWSTVAVTKDCAPIH